MRYLVVGNSGSGKSTLAKRLPYATRDDACSLAAHRALFDGFAGTKHHLTSREKIAAFSG